MLKREIMYENIDGEKITKMYYFHISLPEMIQLEKKTGGYQAYLENLVKSNDVIAFAEHIEEIILLSYGERDEETQSFVKSEEAKNRFKHSPAFEVLLVDLITSVESMQAFVNNVISPEVRKKLAQINIQQQTLPPPPPSEGSSL